MNIDVDDAFYTLKNKSSVFSQMFSEISFRLCQANVLTKSCMQGIVIALLQRLSPIRRNGKVLIKWFCRSVSASRPKLHQY